jgi:hypothetical protein
MPVPPSNEPIKFFRLTAGRHTQIDPDARRNEDGSYPETQYSVGDGRVIPSRRDLRALLGEKFERVPDDVAQQLMASWEKRQNQLRQTGPNQAEDPENVQRAMDGMRPDREGVQRAAEAGADPRRSNQPNAPAVPVAPASSATVQQTADAKARNRQEAGIAQGGDPLDSMDLKELLTHASAEEVPLKGVNQKDPEAVRKAIRQHAGK